MSPDVTGSKRTEWGVEFSRDGEHIYVSARVDESDARATVDNPAGYPRSRALGVTLRVVSRRVTVGPWEPAQETAS